MPLTRDPHKKGLWLDPAADRNSPGTFAVIIGASRYTNLSKVNFTQIENKPYYSLKQIPNSASTAYRFFQSQSALVVGRAGR